MALQPNDAAAWISIFRQHMDEMFNHIFHMKEHGGCHHEFSPHIDVYETADAYVIEMDLPGLSENDFAVSQLGSVIRVEGIKRLEKMDATMGFICLERHFGRFSRSVEIPAQFDVNGARAAYERGGLRIVVPRVAE
ncbi:MAG TPA: Hsp20/alpha crystallin family protein [Geobacteraceae bacterium]|nr:Hsp20/alpha crystallin family protein [Geobacteraceae bacterium]